MVERVTAARSIAAIVERTLAIACGVVLAATLALVLVTALQRYLLGGFFLGAEELAIWLLLAVVCLGFPLVAAGAPALRIDLFSGSNRFPRTRAVLSDAVIFAAAFALLSAGTKAALAIGGTSPLLGLPEGIKPAALAAAGALAALLRLLNLLAEGRFRHLIPVALLALLLWAGPVHLPHLAGIPPSAAAAFAILLGLLAGAPMPHVFILGGHIAIAFGSPLVEPAVAMTVLSGMGRHLLLAIPFFLLAGTFLVLSGLAADLFRFAAAIVGARRGAMGQTVLLTGLMFSGTSGSSIAHAAFGGKTFHRPLVEAGYAPERAGALIAATSLLDNIVPPSIAFFMLAAATNLPVGELMMGGLVAGLVLTLVLAIVIHLTAPPVEARPAAPREPILPLAIRTLPVVGMGVIVVAGIRLGLVSPTEAAALAAGYTLIAALWRRAGGRDILSAFRSAGVETAAILVLIGAAGPIGFLLATDGVAAAVGRFALALGDNPFLVLLAANVLLLVIGLALDTGAAILLFAPILVPVVASVGIDPVHFGVLLVVNLMIGGLTPPVGILAQVVAAATASPVAALFRSLTAYYAALLPTFFITCGALFLLSNR